MSDLLSFAQVADLLKVHTDDVARWARTEQCPVVVIGRRKRIPRDWVNAQFAG